MKNIYDQLNGKEQYAIIQNLKKALIALFELSLDSNNCKKIIKDFGFIELKKTGFKNSEESSAFYMIIVSFMVYDDIFPELREKYENSFAKIEVLKDAINYNDIEAKHRTSEPSAFSKDRLDKLKSMIDKSETSKSSFLALDANSQKQHIKIIEYCIKYLIRENVQDSQVSDIVYDVNKDSHYSVLTKRFRRGAYNSCFLIAMRLLFKEELFIEFDADTDDNNEVMDIMHNIISIEDLRKEVADEKN